MQARNTGAMSRNCSSQDEEPVKVRGRHVSKKGSAPGARPSGVRALRVRHKRLGSRRPPRGARCPCRAVTVHRGQERRAAALEHVRVVAVEVRQPAEGGRPSRGRAGAPAGRPSLVCPASSRASSHSRISGPTRDTAGPARAKYSRSRATRARSAPASSGATRGGKRAQVALPQAVQRVHAARHLLQMPNALERLKVRNISKPSNSTSAVSVSAMMSFPQFHRARLGDRGSWSVWKMAGSGHASRCARTAAAPRTSPTQKLGGHAEDLDMCIQGGRRRISVRSSRPVSI